ncbi:hypothetical protein Q5752_000645 [Cryptotrichosporon argae]
MAAASPSTGATPSAAFTTPTKRVALAEAGPSRIRPAGASPAYSSRRHSLYGIDDRVIIDPGSRVWKVGFSGEPDPRAVFWAHDGTHREMYDLDPSHLAGVYGSRSEGRRLSAVRVVRKLRDMFHKHLMTDPKSRKVVVLEPTFMPLHVKEDVARALFDNLAAPSVAFTPAAVVALVACGRVTGLVVDCGWLETTVTPVSYSRPLYHLARSTPLAGRALHDRVRVLLARATFAPLVGATTPLHPARLTDALIERVITEACYVGPVLVNGMDVDEPPEPAPAWLSDDEAALLRELEARYAASGAREARFRLEDGEVIVPGWIRERAAEVLFGDGPDDVADLATLVLSTLLSLPVDLRPQLASSILVVGGTASLPSFIPRMRIDLLRHLLPPPSSSLPSPARPSASAPTPPPAPTHAAGTATPPAPTPLAAVTPQDVHAWRHRHREPWRALYGLATALAIVNDASPPAGTAGGRGPRWAPGLASWVGGSLAGAAKTSSPEMTRESYDARVADSVARAEAFLAELDECDVRAAVGASLDDLRPGMARSAGGRKGWADEGVVGDWSRGLRVQ